VVAEKLVGTDGWRRFCGDGEGERGRRGSPSVKGLSETKRKRAIAAAGVEVVSAACGGEAGWRTTLVLMLNAVGLDEWGVWGSRIARARPVRGRSTNSCTQSRTKPPTTFPRSDFFHFSLPSSPVTLHHLRAVLGWRCCCTLYFLIPFLAKVDEDLCRRHASDLHAACQRSMPRLG